MIALIGKESSNYATICWILAGRHLHVTHIYRPMKLITMSHFVAHESIKSSTVFQSISKSSSVLEPYNLLSFK